MTGSSTACPGSFEIVDEPAAEPAGDGAWTLEPAAGEGVFATFALPEQMVGFPFLAIEAAAGTVVELITQESHAPSGPAWLDTHRFSWTRLVCREGDNRFEAFDYESLRFLQLHVHEASGPVTLRDVGVRRRTYPWPTPPRFRLRRPAAAAGVRGLVQHARQLGAGDDRRRHGPRAPAVQRRRRAPAARDAPRLRRPPAGPPLPAHLPAGPDARGLLPRLLAGLGPAEPDRPARGRRDAVGAAARPRRDARLRRLAPPPGDGRDGRRADALYPRFVRFADFLLARVGRDGLLPVEGWGVPAVWIDNGFARQRHKQCAFNLFTAAVLRDALAPIAALAGDAAGAKRCAAACRRPRGRHRAPVLERGARPLRLQPAVGGRGGRVPPRRPLARHGAALRPLPGRAHGRVRAGARPRRPPSLVLGYPANAHWRMQALARHGRIDAVLRELARALGAPALGAREPHDARGLGRAAATRSDQWSHCAVGPAVRHCSWTSPASVPRCRASSVCAIRPQLGDLPALELTCHTVRGPIGFRAESRGRRPPRGGDPAGRTCRASCCSPAGSRGRRRARQRPGARPRPLRAAGRPDERVRPAVAPDRRPANARRWRGIGPRRRHRRRHGPPDAVARCYAEQEWHRP